MRALSLLSLALSLSLASGPAFGQDAPKGQSKSLELWGTFREQMADGKFDVAALFLQQFLDSNPMENDLLEVEKKYGTTVFQSLRNVPRWSDDAAVEKKARANAEELIKRARAANEKLLYDPKRVAKFIRNLGATVEERGFAELELKRTGDYAIPFMVDELRNTRDRDVFAGLLESIGMLEAPTIAGWVAALDGLTVEQQLGVVASIVARPDILNLQAAAQTDLVPFLWRVLAQRANENPAFREMALRFLSRLQPGIKVDGKLPLVELVSAARTFYDHTARFGGTRNNGDGTPITVPVWIWDAAGEKLVKIPEAPISRAEEYYGLRYARWALEANPTFDPARGLLISLAAEKAIERARFGNLAKVEPVVFKLLSETPTAILAAQLERGLGQKRTGLALAMIQVLGDRQDRDSTALFLKALSYPDPQVQFAAADALLRSGVNVPADARVRVVDILRRAAASDPGAPDAAGTALLADPNRTRAEAVAGMLRGLGYQVDVMTTGRDLLRRIERASDFDLILIDHHTPNPELIDLIGQIRADSGSADRPTLVLASPDKMPPPSFDQLVVRFAALIASTENDTRDIPRPFNPTDPAYKATTPTDLVKLQKESIGLRDAAIRRAVESRLGRLNRLIDSTGIKLTDTQRLLLTLRTELLTYAVLNFQYPFSEDNAPEAVVEVNKLQRQLAAQPPTPVYGAGIPTADMLKLAERFEADLARVPTRQAEFEKLYARIDPGEFGMTIQTFRDPQAEFRLARQLHSYPGVRVVAEPYGRTALVGELQLAYQDPALAPRDPATKKATQKQAVEWLSKMAMGDVSGYEIASAEKELRAALRVDDLASAAIDAVSRFRSAGAQEDLLVLVLNRMRPLATRSKAADAVIRHIQQNGSSIPKTLIQPLVELSGAEADLGLRGKLLTLKGMLAFEPGDFAKQLTGYNPPLVAPKPIEKAPEKEKEKEKE